MIRKSRRKPTYIVSTSSTGWPKWKQSPIDLNQVNVRVKKFPPLLLSGHWLNEGTANITNTGQTVQIELHNREIPYISGGPLKDYYQFLYLQFRWGEDNCHGAEHAIDNTWYSMEAQVIHWNTRYGGLEKCYDKSDGIAIISYLFLVSGCSGIADNPEFTKITHSLSNIKMVGQSADISPDCLKWMTNCFSYPGYYTYQGSLTTSPYNECVIWIIIPRPLRISLIQMEKFREIYNNRSTPILTNCRSQQLLHGRKIFYADEKASGITFSTLGLPKLGQSPIDIDDKSVLPTRFPPLFLSGHWLKDGDAIMVNNGKTAKITLSGDRIPSTVKGGPLLGDEYEFQNVHFHWGEENCRGSEHTINNTWFSMEAHAVHWNRKYVTMEECLKHKDGICVLAFLFLATDKNSLWSNPQLEGITENLKNITELKSETKVPANCLQWMKTCLTVPSYYTYQGSLTTPSYDECVTWIVIPKALPISPKQIDEFRKLKNEEGGRILANTRKIQNLRGRRIFLAVNTPI